MKADEVFSKAQTAIVNVLNMCKCRREFSYEKFFSDGCFGSFSLAHVDYYKSAAKRLRSNGSEQLKPIVSTLAMPQ
jgi:hypothetical protein